MMTINQSQLIFFTQTIPEKLVLSRPNVSGRANYIEVQEWLIISSFFSPKSRSQVGLLKERTLTGSAPAAAF